MRRRGTGNKIVKNCIVWAMSAMIAVGSIAPAQVVRAEGTETQQVEQTDNTVNSYHQCDVHTDSKDGGGAPDSTDSSFHDNEAQKNAQASTEIQTMTKQADAAADAAADAKQAVAAAQQAVNDAKADAALAQTAAVTEQSAADTAEGEANKAKTAVDGLNDKAAENIDAYNKNVTDANKAAADGAAELNNGVVINEKQTDGTTTPNVNVADVQGYAEDQAAAAEAAKATAEKELQAALDVPATDYNDPAVKQHVYNVKAAATEAQTAADNAAAVVTAADQELLDKITEYNASALEFGTDPYPYTAADGTVTYPGYPSTSTGENPTQVDIEANKKAAQDAKAKLAADKKAIDYTNMAAAATAVNAAATAKTAAETAKQTAVDAAADAATAVDTMNKKINGNSEETTPEAKAGDLKTANDNCALVSDHDVTPAQQKLLDTATATRDADQDTLNAATATRDATVKEAEDKFKEQKIDELYASINSALLDQSANVNQTEYDKAANDWANGFKWSQVGTALVNGLSADNIVLSKAEIRYAMDHSTEYGNGSGGSFFGIIKRSISNIINTTPVAQLPVSPELVDGNIDKAINAAQSQMTSYNEKMQVVRANAARLDVQSAATTAKTVKADQSANQLTVDNIKTEVEAASSKIDTATTTYNTAKNKLDGLKAAVKDKSISNADLSALKAAIAAAQAKVDSAKDALKEAKAAAASAENYKNWATTLTTQQSTMAFGQAATDAYGNAVDKDGNIAKNANDRITATVNKKDFDNLGDDSVISREVKYFTQNLANKTVDVPYSIYREYVSRMYDQYNYTERASQGKGKGKGISTSGTGATMPVVYWEIDKNGKLTGKSYLSTDANLKSGTYFVGYTFKAESDGYHIDGVQMTYTKPVIPTPGPTPTPEQPTTVTTISNAPAALAATPAVLGVRRAPVATETAAPAVLGANRAYNQAVLGAKRGAATGDDTNAAGWIALMICTMGAGAAVVLGRRKEQENAQ